MADRQEADFDTYPEAHARAAHEDEQEIIRTGQPIVGKLQKATLNNGKSVLVALNKDTVAQAGTETLSAHSAFPRT